MVQSTHSRGLQSFAYISVLVSFSVTVIKPLIKIKQLMEEILTDFDSQSEGTVHDGGDGRWQEQRGGRSHGLHNQEAERWG